MVWGLGSPTGRLSYFVRSFKLSFQLPKLTKSFKHYYLNPKPQDPKPFSKSPPLPLQIPDTELQIQNPNLQILAS